MTRSEGFAVMDVSTSICDDPKFRRLQRERPELVAVAFAAYLACMAESWKAGRRVPVDHAWPAFLTYEQGAVDALVAVGLLDRKGLLNVKAWRGWFTPAFERREKARDRWARYNEKRDADTTPPPRGTNVSTATSVPSVPSVRQSVPSGPSTRDAARGKKDGAKPDNDDERRRLLQQASDDFKAGRLTEIDYQRIRREQSA